MHELHIEKSTMLPNISIMNVDLNTTNCMDDNGENNCTLPLLLRILYIILLIIISIFSSIGNSIVCYIVFKKATMRSAINLLLASLALSHLLLTITCIPITMITIATQSWIFGKVFCKINGMIFSLLVAQATCLILTITVDRYCIIVLRHDKLNPQKARILIVIVVTISLFISLPPCIGFGQYTYYNGWPQCGLKTAETTLDIAYYAMLFTLVFYFPMIIMCLCYISIYHKVRTNLRRIKNCPDIHSTAAKLGLQLAPLPNSNLNMSVKTRAYKTILITYIVYCICWLPYSISIMAIGLTDAYNTSYSLGTGVIVLGYSNAALNPILYFWRILKFREACSELLPKLVKWIPEFTVRKRRRINPQNVYQVPVNIPATGM